MNLVLKLSTLAVRTLVDGTCKSAGVSEAKDAAIRIAKILNQHFTDHSQRLTAALQLANDRAWSALELSLAGESFWERCKAATARTEDKAFARQVRAFLDAARLSESSAEPVDRQKCLQELRAARKAGMLTTGALHPQELAEQTAAFVRFSDPQNLFDAEGRIIEAMGRELKEAGFGNLAVLIAQQPHEGRPLLVIAVRYFFRRAVEEDTKLFQGLAFTQLDRLGKEQEEGFASLHALMSQQGKRLEGLLADVHIKVIETHSAVLDLQGQIEGQSGQLQEIGVAVQKLLEQHQLHRREVRPGDSLSIRNDNERQLVKQLVSRYRSLPEEERRQVPALLNGIGKLEVVAGDFDAARKDFATVATLVEDNKLQAEAHFNAYQACLERRDWPAAIQEFIKAVKLDAKRFASFPVGKYQPQRILGAGGFGVAFLCKHKYMDAQVVVKTLMLEELGRDADKVFMEAQVLRQLEHPAIIRISDCGYVDSTNRSRPFLVMDYFEGGTLEEHVKKHGPLSVEDLLAVMRPVAEGLKAAHGKGILHRDVKPANLLVLRSQGEPGASAPGGWQAKVIDFGLAMRQKVVKTSMSANTAKRSKTMVGGSIAGTLDYAAPEQLGKRDDAVGPYSDVFGWAKTCCYALFQTTQPLFTHWQSIPLPLAQVLERCLSEDPAKRPQSFAEVLKSLNTASAPSDQETRQSAVVPTFDFAEPAAEMVKLESSRPLRRKRERSKLSLLIGGAALALLASVLFFTVVLRSKTNVGMLVVEIDQPGAEVLIDGKQYTITQPGDKEPIQIEVQEGTRNLKVVKGGFETFTRAFTVKSGGKETVRVRLEPVKIAAKDTKRPPPPSNATAESPLPSSILAPEEPKRPALLDCTRPEGVSAAEVRRSQEAWAKYLGREVEEEVEVAGGVMMTFVLVPPGKFLMGSPEDEKERAVHERLHKVTLMKLFDLGKTEVTQAQYEAIGMKNASTFKGRNLPVEQVSWTEARDWTEQLTKNRNDKHLYRLATEAEWEYSCRGGRPSALPFGVGNGRALSSREANFNGNFPYGGAEKGIYLEATCPVASYPANALGLHDMHGNVWEWCADWYGAYPSGAWANPTGPVKGSFRVIRGGSWRLNAKDCRAAIRLGGGVDGRNDNLGFRLARSVWRLPPITEKQAEKNEASALPAEAQVKPRVERNRGREGNRSRNQLGGRDSLRVKVSLKSPYPQSYRGAPTDKISVQYAVIELLKQAGVEYDFKKSQGNVGELARRWITPNIVDQPCATALDHVLGSVGLTYQLMDNKVVLKRK